MINDKETRHVDVRQREIESAEFLDFRRYLLSHDLVFQCEGRGSFHRLNQSCTSRYGLIAKLTRIWSGSRQWNQSRLDLPTSILITDALSVLYCPTYV